MWLLVAILLTAIGFKAFAVPWEDIPERSAAYSLYNKELDDACRSQNPMSSLMKLAREAERDYAARLPSAAAMMLHTTGLAFNWIRFTNSAAHEAYYDVMARSRAYLPALSLGDQLNILTRSEIPLSTLITNRVNGGYQGSELEVLLGTWRAIETERLRVRDWPFEVVYASTQRDFFPRDAAGELAYQEEKSRNEEAAKRANFVAMLRNDGSRFTNRVMQQVARQYAITPALLFDLQETMDGYLPPAISTNVMNKVFAAMKPEVAAKTPRPVPGAKGDRWLRPAAAPAGPVTPAVARPSKVLEGIRQQQAAQSAQAAGAAKPAPAESPAGMVAASGAVPAWAWAALGLVALAGGWVWVKTKS